MRVIFFGQIVDKETILSFIHPNLRPEYGVSDEGGTTMPICSYLVYPAAGKADELVETLNAIPECEARKSDNRDLMILMTDTPDDRREKTLQEQLKTIPSIQCMAMTFGAMEEESESGGLKHE